jgi:hypothetical protein
MHIFMQSLPNDLSVPRCDSNKIPEIDRKMPDAWVKCSLCFGTGYVFSPVRLGIKANMGVTIATMTSDRCETCMGRGFVRYFDA